MTDEELAKHRLWKANHTELITEYPFFRDGMTVGEFDEEQAAYFAYYAAGGKPENYKSLWKQRQEKSGNIRRWKKN